MRFRRAARPLIDVRRGERVLAWAETADGTAGGTRDALYLPDPATGWTRIAWEDVETADWDSETDRLRVLGVGSWGQPRPVHELTVSDPGQLLELVRERVTASVVLQRRVEVEGGRGVRVIARRAPRGNEPLTWLVDYDDGLDPADPAVSATVERALADVRAEVGEA